MLFLKSFLYTFFFALSFFIISNNLNAASESLNRSEQILKDIKKQAEILNYYNF